MFTFMKNQAAKTQISIVIPLLNEEENIMEVYYKINDTLRPLNKNYEVIFIDDVSEDETHKIISGLQTKDHRVKIIKLVKHCGQLNALLAGFEFARGEVIVTMDGDLQNDPKDIPKFLDKIEEGFDFVNGWRFERNDCLGRKLFSKIANLLISIRTGKALHDYGCAFTATKKQLIDRLMDYGDSARFIKPLLVKLAASSTEIKIRHYPRIRGASKYDLAEMTRTGLDFLLNFSLDKNNIKSKEDISYVIEEVSGE